MKQIKGFLEFSSVELGGNQEIVKIDSPALVNINDIKFIEPTLNKEVIKITMKNNHYFYIKMRYNKIRRALCTINI